MTKKDSIKKCYEHLVNEIISAIDGAIKSKDEDTLENMETLGKDVLHNLAFMMRFSKIISLDQEISIRQKWCGIEDVIAKAQAKIAEEKSEV